MTRRPPSRRAWKTFSTAVSIKSACRSTRVICMPAGNVAWRSWRTASSVRVSVSVLVPGCFCTPRMTAGCVLTEPSPRLGAASTCTRPRSATRIGHAVLRGDHRGPDVLRRPHAAQAGHQVFRAADDHEARRDILVGGRERLRDLFQGDPVGAQLRGREEHLILFLTATDGDHLGHPWHGEEAAAQDGVGGGAELDRTVCAEVNARKRISPMIDEMGASTGREISGGRSPQSAPPFH